MLNLKKKLIKNLLVIQPCIQRNVAVCTCNTANLETKFRNRVGSTPVMGNSPLIV